MSPTPPPPELPFPPITARPDVRGGEPCFAGTRLPVQMLFEHLEEGYSVDQFIEFFDAVSRQQVLAVLEFCKAAAIRAAA